LNKNVVNRKLKRTLIIKLYIMSNVALLFRLLAIKSLKGNKYDRLREGNFKIDPDHD